VLTLLIVLQSFQLCLLITRDSLVPCLPIFKHAPKFNSWLWSQLRTEKWNLVCSLLCTPALGALICRMEASSYTVSVGCKKRQSEVKCRVGPARRWAECDSRKKCWRGLSLPANPAQHTLKRRVFVEPVVLSSVSDSEVVHHGLVCNVWKFLWRR